MSKRTIPQIGAKVIHEDGWIGTVTKWTNDEPEWGGGEMRIEFTYPNPQTDEPTATYDEVSLARFMSGESDWSNYGKERN